MLDRINLGLDFSKEEQVCTLPIYAATEGQNRGQDWQISLQLCLMCTTATGNLRLAGAVTGCGVATSYEWGCIWELQVSLPRRSTVSCSVLHQLHYAVICCELLFWTVLYCAVLRFALLYCIVLCYAVMCCTALCCIVLHWIVLRCTVLCCAVLCLLY